jgi:hypothetical protein
MLKARSSQMHVEGRTKQNRELADPEQNAQETKRSLIWFARSSQMQAEQNRRENSLTQNKMLKRQGGR